MKENIKYFLGLWFILIVGLIWLQGGGRYSSSARVNLLFTLVMSFIITIIIILYFIIRDKFR